MHSVLGADTLLTVPPGVARTLLNYIIKVKYHYFILTVTL